MRGFADHQDAYGDPGAGWADSGGPEAPRSYGSHPMARYALTCSWCGCLVSDLQTHEAVDCRGGTPLAVELAAPGPRLRDALLVLGVWLTALGVLLGLLLWRAA